MPMKHGIAPFVFLMPSHLIMLSLIKKTPILRLPLVPSTKNLNHLYLTIIFFNKFLTLLNLIFPLFNTTNCKYYECHELNSVFLNNKSNSFSAFHINIASLNCHFDELNALLAQLQH